MSSASDIPEIPQPLLHDLFFLPIKLAAWVLYDLLQKKDEEALEAVKFSFQPRLRFTA